MEVSAILEQQSNVYIRGTNPDMVYRLSKTLTLFLAWVCLGLFNEVVGPTLTDLRNRVGANYEEIGRILSARSAGLFLGSMFGGVMYDRFTRYRDLGIAISLIMSGCGILFSPWISVQWLLGIVFHLQGWGHGLQTTGCNPTLVFLWADRTPGPMNFLHAGFGLGAAIAPFLARPYMSHELDESVLVNSSSTMEPPDSFIEVPYTVVGCCNFLISIVFIVYFLRKSPRMFNNALQEKKSFAEIVNPRSCGSGSSAFGIQMGVLIFIYYMFVVGGERAYGKFVFSYAVDSDLNFSKDQAAILNSVYWISFTASRFLSFAIALWVPIEVMLFGQVLGTVVSAIGLNVFRSNHTAFWIFTSTFGAFKAPLFPSLLGFINNYINVTSITILIVNIGSATGGMLVQWLTGYLFEYMGPVSFVHIILGYSICILLIYTTMFVVTRRRGVKYELVVKYEAGKDEDSSGSGQEAIILQDMQ